MCLCLLKILAHKFIENEMCILHNMITLAYLFWPCSQCFEKTKNLHHLPLPPIYHSNVHTFSLFQIFWRIGKKCNATSYHSHLFLIFIFSPFSFSCIYFYSHCFIPRNTRHALVLISFKRKKTGCMISLFHLTLLLPPFK